MEKRNKIKRVETTLRLPQDLHEELELAAAKVGRSVNEEILHRCRVYVEAVTLHEIARQNAELKKMLQLLIDMQD